MELLTLPRINRKTAGFITKTSKFWYVSCKNIYCSMPFSYGSSQFLYGLFFSVSYYFVYIFNLGSFFSSFFRSYFWSSMVNDSPTFAFTYCSTSNLVRPLFSADSPFSKKWTIFFPVFINAGKCQGIFNSPLI